MPTSYRIKTILNNKSFYTTPDRSSGVGATVIPASRGPIKPVKVNRGESERIKQLFGADRYEVLEAIAYNNKYPLWIASPTSGGATASMLLTSVGLIPAPLSFNGDIETLDFNNLKLQYKLGIADGKTSVFGNLISSKLVPDDLQSPRYVLDMSLVEGDTPYPLTVDWVEAPKGVKATLHSDEIGDGTMILDPDEDTIALEFTFTTPPDKGTPLSIRLSTDLSQFDFDTFAIIGMRFPCDDFLALSIYKAEAQGQLTMDLKTKKKGNYYQQTGYPVNFSLVKGALDASGNVIYAKELFKDDDFIFILPNPDVSMDIDSWTSSSTKVVDFEGGSRGIECNSQMLVDAWEQYKDFKKYPADIYFDVTADTGIPSEFNALREAIPYRQFLYPYPITTKPSDIKDVPKECVPMVQNRGICAFWGAAYILNPYEATGNLLSTLMGEVASRYADAKVNSYGGRAVAWGDENNVGGQLSQGRVVEFLYNATEDEMKALDKLGINPIVLNELFGPMVASRRTTDQSMSDYSYSDYSMVVDYCLEKIVTEVLPYQLIKFNDDQHRAAVRNKVDNILKPLLQEPNNVIRDYAVKCDAENNGDDILTQQLFVLTVAIKVTPKSEYIQFTFINSAQGGSVEEDVK